MTRVLDTNPYHGRSHNTNRTRRRCLLADPCEHMADVPISVVRLAWALLSHTSLIGFNQNSSLGKSLDRPPPGGKWIPHQVEASRYSSLARYK